MDYAKNIIESLGYLQKIIDCRLKKFFQKENNGQFDYPELVLEPDDSPLYHFLVRHKLNIEEYIILLLSLMPHIQPNFMDPIIQSYLPHGGEFPEIGGVKGNSYRSTMPTGETAMFLLAGNDISKRMQATKYFSADHFFTKENILMLESAKDGEPRMSGRLILQPDYVDLFTIGVASKPIFGPDFPAKLVTTKLNWDDIILTEKTRKQIDHIKTWLLHNPTFLNDWEMEKRVKPGYRSLFFGPPGTGKTFAATLLGNQFNRQVYRIDLSQVVSKFIGETEKNLEKIFNKAEYKDWILFFDEADALFGKRSNIQNAHDKYANQEVSYLLQRVEDFPGMVILASNNKNYLDSAFIRRFNSIIHFPMPSEEERFAIWKKNIPPKVTLAPNLDLRSIAARYELTGSAIVNIIHFACLQTISKQTMILSKEDVLEGIRLEYEKEDKVFN